MHPLLEKLLKKNGIKGVEELKGDEKKTYDRWQSILSEGDITVEKIANFCQSQVDVIERKWADHLLDKRERLIDQHVIYKTLLKAITSPQAERENLERYLNSLV